MTHQSSVANTRHFICALGTLVLLAGTALALAQTPTAPTIDKSGAKGTPTPAAARQAPMEKKGSAMGGMKDMPASGDMRGSMMSMTKGMESMQMSGDTDRDFAAMMKMHHQGAIDMSQVELQSGKDPQMRAMAKRIIEAQKKEIKEFEQWLAKRKASEGGRSGK